MHIRALREGSSPMSPLMARQLLARWHSARPAAAAAGRAPGAVLAQPLSPRESQVLDLISRGFTYLQIGAQLKVSVSTVQIHERSIDVLVAPARSGIRMRRLVAGQAWADRRPVLPCVPGAGSVVLGAGVHDLRVVRTGVVEGVRGPRVPLALFLFVRVMAGTVVQRHSASVAEVSIAVGADGGTELTLIWPISERPMNAG